ncbi:MAG: DoxX family protein [Candidatus Saccharibacteria bacterium]|nr:DoxX family protein [Rhodoferax sp.]
MANSFYQPPRVETAATTGNALRTGLALIFLWFFVGGLAHFVATDLEAQIVPPYIPWPHEVVLITGVLEVLGALGLLWRATRRWAGVGLFLLTIAVTPANIYMLQHASEFAVPYGLLWLRLPLQVGLLWLIWWSAIRKQPQFAPAPATPLG